MAGAGGRFWSATMKRPEMIPFRWRSSIYERDTYRAPNCKSLRQTLVHSGEQSRSVALDRIDWEIRMIPGVEFNFDAGPLFWLELFDRSTKTSVDGFSCHRIRDAVPGFDDFISQACRSNEPDGARR